MSKKERACPNTSVLKLVLRILTVLSARASDTYILLMHILARKLHESRDVANLHRTHRKPAARFCHFSQEQTLCATEGVPKTTRGRE